VISRPGRRSSVRGFGGVEAVVIQSRRHHGPPAEIAAPLAQALHGVGHVEKPGMGERLGSVGKIGQLRPPRFRWHDPAAQAVPRGAFAPAGEHAVNFDVVDGLAAGGGVAEENQFCRGDGLPRWEPVRRRCRRCYRSAPGTESADCLRFPLSVSRSEDRIVAVPKGGCGLIGAYVSVVGAVVAVFGPGGKWRRRAGASVTNAPVTALTLAAETA